ncbi:MAG: TonB-dependent receptor domain-containing protein, partial [Myxococcales bacterium]
MVTATRPAASASETRIGQEVIAVAPRQGAVDLLRLVPGLVASQHSGEGKAHQLFLRGFDAVHGQDVELEVAGIPVNQVSHVHALGYADLNFLIPEVVREIRIAEGSYRADQGDFAVAGTVRFDLGMAEPGAQVSGTLGQFGQRRLFAGVRPGESPETFAAAELVQGDGFGPQRAFGRASVLGQAVTEVKGPGERPVRLRAFFGSYGARFDSPGVVREDDVLAGRRGFFDATAPGQGGAATRHQLLLGAELPREGATRTRLEAFGVLSTLRLRNNFTGYVRDPRGDGLEQTQDASTAGVRAEHRRLVPLLDRPLALTLGVGARRDDIDQAQRRYRDSDGAYVGDDIDARIVQTDVFGHGEAELPLGRWKFLLGGRADALAFDVFDALAFDGTGRARSAFGVHLGLKAGISRLIAERWQLFANYGDGFRSPQAR